MVSILGNEAIVQLAAVVIAALWLVPPLAEGACAGHMEKSKSCGANPDNHPFNCCSGFVCEEKYCVIEGSCAGHMEKSKGCGANPDNHPLNCCSGSTCEEKFCVDPKMEDDGGGMLLNINASNIMNVLTPEEQRLWERARLRRSVERQALVQLYNETGGEKWYRQGGWLNNSVEHCNWEGVGCSRLYGVVVKLDLPQNNLVGPLPDLSQFQYLREIEMQANSLKASGTLKVESPSIRRIDLSKNNLNGNIGAISEKLEYLDLSFNTITGRFEPTFNGTSCPNNLTYSNSTAFQMDSSLTRLNSTRISNMTNTFLNESRCGPRLEYLNLADNEMKFVNVSELVNLRFFDLSKNYMNGSMNQTLSDIGPGELTYLESLILAGSWRLKGALRVGHMQQLKVIDLSDLRLKNDINATGLRLLPALERVNLAGNEFHGEFSFCDMTMLKEIQLGGGNQLFGNITNCSNLTSLQICDLSENEFTGTFDLTAASSTLEYIDLFQNNFNGPLPALGNLTKLKYLHFGANQFTGTLPELQKLPALLYLNISYNSLTGTIPTTISQLRLLTTLDLSNNAQTSYDPLIGNRITLGLSGQLPEGIGQVSFLQQLILSHNLISGTLPDSISRLAYLNHLDLGDNNIASIIPTSINILEQLDTVLLERNKLSGTIPALGGSSEKVRTVKLAGNPDLIAPAPFTLCDLDELDLRTNQKYCPPDRSALAAFYSSTLGTEWLRNDNWLSGDVHHCFWYGVSCDCGQIDCSESNDISRDFKKVIALNLTSNGVAGQFPPEFFSIKTLQLLDLTDNDIRGEVPSLIGTFTDLRFLRLSYNRITGLPREMKNLTKLALVHLQSNRLSGSGSVVRLAKPSQRLDIVPELPEHKYVADCGDPQDAPEPFVCEECDMCCNSLEECQVPLRQSLTVEESTFALIAAVIVVLAIIWLIVRCLVIKEIIPEPTFIALEAAGEESVYCFFLARAKGGWVVAVGTLSVQVAIFALFLAAASFDNDDGDFVYSWRCPLNSLECNDERAVGTYGWVMWTFLVLASLLDDFVNGLKLLFLSSARGSPRCFVAGIALFGITSFAVYASLQYNVAIAMTNTELIINAVILLFVNEIDEQVFHIVRILKSKWLDSILQEAQKFSSVILDEHLRETRRPSQVEREREARDYKESSLFEGSSSPKDRKRFLKENATEGDAQLDYSPKGSSVKVDSHEELLNLLQSMQNRINMLEQNNTGLDRAGDGTIISDQAKQAESQAGPVTDEPQRGCTLQ